MSIKKIAGRQPRIKQVLRIGPSYELVIDPTCQRALSVGRNISLWDLPTGRRIVRSHPFSHPSYANWSLDGRRLCLSSTSGELVRLDVDSLKVVAQLLPYGSGEGPPAVFSPNGRRVLAANWAGVLKIIDADSGHKLLDHPMPGGMIATLESSRDATRVAIVVSPTSAQGRSARTSIYIGEWSDHGIKLKRLPLDPKNVDALAFDGAGRRLALLRWEQGRNLASWIDQLDLTTFDIRSVRIPTLSLAGATIAWDKDDRTIAIAGRDGFHFIAADSMKEIANAKMPYACRVEFSRDGEWVALGAWQNGVLRRVKDLFSA